MLAECSSAVVVLDIVSLMGDRVVLLDSDEVLRSTNAIFEFDVDTEDTKLGLLDVVFFLSVTDAVSGGARVDDSTCDLVSEGAVGDAVEVLDPLIVMDGVDVISLVRLASDREYVTV